MKDTSPPFKITSLILEKSQAISRALGVIAGQKISETPLKLRRTNTVKTIQASLAIEGNTLAIGQITDLLDGKRVLGPAKDILEVKNAFRVYSNLKKFNPLKIDELLRAHKILMEGLVSENGKLRAGGVGICKGQEVSSHVAPPAKRVPALMENLFNFLAKNKEYSWLLKACVFHYELEFIHPFSDGNGRMGRLWQQRLLMKEDPVFEFIPVEVLIRNNQETYYRVLGQSDAAGESTVFIEFCLDIIYKTLVEYSKMTSPIAKDAVSRLHYAKNHIQEPWFSRIHYLSVHKDISSATASRDLLVGVKKGMLEKKGEHNQALYRFS